jgi:hypothetical protein
MNTIEKVNVIELASELANRKLIEYSDALNESDYRFEFPNGLLIEDEEETSYTQEAQDIFNEYYDEYLTLIEMCKE